MNEEKKLQIANCINSDPDLADAFAQRRFGDVAAKLEELLPRIPKSLPLSQMGVLALYRDDQDTAFAMLDALDEAAKTNSKIRRIVNFMGPGTPDGSLPDFGIPAIRDSLIAPKQAGGVGLTQSQVAILFEAGEQRQSVTAIEVESLWEELNANAN